MALLPAPPLPPLKDSANLAAHGANTTAINANPHENFPLRMTRCRRHLRTVRCWRRAAYRIEYSKITPSSESSGAVRG
jgi:hypothetical protein